ncbi:MAG: methylenetetrahydrofolate reductase C-terminal domain-containing protein [Deltaproteobacteria bacterium]|nr:methylenetetrahydrofolate reductase C-terminal domain-containing protein [Candidatus Anaeroferrophillus wilburensis]MBN2889156.1 methylenetetrahydrofolate reductase C-terminal domain-containing protein [Deltaproteobacteria bacterium]
MIIAERKPLDEIKEMVKSYKKVLNVGCGGCTSICLAGGQKEVVTLNAELKNALQGDNINLIMDNFVIERQCNYDFFTDLDEMIAGYDAVLSMACGVGVQFVAERYPETPVFPALNTVFCGVDRNIGWFEENCRTCGECVLAETAGICPVTRCAKGVFNGPCGGTRLDGTCEVDKDTPCAWYEIHKRLQAQGRLANILTVKPPREWQNQTRRSLIQEDYKQRYAG